MNDKDSWAGLDCTETVHRLYHFLDGELTTDRREEIRRHLDECSPCLDAFDFEAELRKLISDRCRDRVPDYLRERIAKAIEHEHRSRVGAAVDGPPPRERSSGE
jgi:mycothiol system anti-sigma-R factor